MGDHGHGHFQTECSRLIPGLPALPPRPTLFYFLYSSRTHFSVGPRALKPDQAALLPASGCTSPAILSSHLCETRAKPKVQNEVSDLS